MCVHLCVVRSYSQSTVDVSIDNAESRSIESVVCRLLTHCNNARVCCRLIRSAVSICQVWFCDLQSCEWSVQWRIACLSVGVVTDYSSWDFYKPVCDEHLIQFHFTCTMVISLHCESKKNWATFLRPITLEILNRSLPNLTQITFSSCWTSCHNLFESILENSGTIWRITLTVNKKVIKVMNWQWLRHAVVFAMLLTNALFILSTEEKLWWW